MMEEAKFPFSIVFPSITELKQPMSSLCQRVTQNYPKLGFCLFQSTSMSNFSQARTRHSVCERLACKFLIPPGPATAGATNVIVI